MKIGLHLVGYKNDSSFHQLQLDDMRSLFKVNFSEKEAAYIFFIDFMEECAGNRVHKDFTF